MANQTLHMKPNVAAAIAYVFGWLSGLIVFFLEKENRYVRFHLWLNDRMGGNE